MESYTPRSSVVSVAVGLVLSWIVAPVILLIAVPVATANSYSSRNAIPFVFLGAGISLIGSICLLVGVFRALRTIDFLGRREAVRMEAESYRAGYPQR